MYYRCRHVHFSQRFVASRRETTDAGVDIADAAVGKDDEDNKITGNTDDLDDQDNIDGKRSSSRGSHKSNDSRGGGRGKGENNEGMDAENRRGTESRLGVLSEVITEQPLRCTKETEPKSTMNRSLYYFISPLCRKG